MKANVTKMRVRTTPEARALVVSAAERSGMSISKFVVQAAVEDAVRILERQKDRATGAGMNAKFFAALDELDRRKAAEKPALKS
jgi:uncharacterized protein (DUF1778 family)